MGATFTITQLLSFMDSKTSWIRPTRGFSIQLQGLCEVEALFRKQGDSVTDWLNQGLHLAGNDPVFIKRLDHLGATISRTA